MNRLDPKHGIYLIPDEQPVVLLSPEGCQYISERDEFYGYSVTELSKNGGFNSEAQRGVSR